jgi:ATP-dependent Clp protease ATP-binding subunit ClpA
MNRIDDIVHFNDLQLTDIEQIVAIHVDALAERLGARDVRLNLDQPAREFLAREAMNAGSGARYVHRIVARHVSTPLSTAILRGELPKGSSAEVSLSQQGTLVVRAA